MTIWSPRRITAFLVSWALVMPFKIMLRLSRLDHSIIYAGLWSYLGGSNPFSSYPLIVSVLYTAFNFPFYLPGLLVASFVWQSSTNENITRPRYFNIIMILIFAQGLLAMVIPCVGGGVETLCIPTPTTGLIALPFVSKVVKDIEKPWSEDESDPFQDS